MTTWLRRAPASAPALADTRGDRRLTYGELVARVDAAAAVLHGHGGRSLVFLAMDNSMESVILYLACRAAAWPVVLIEPNPESLARLWAAYRPSLLLLPPAVEAPGGLPGWPFPGEGSYGLALDPSAPPRALHPDLAVLLTTSGSTGNPKLVRLSGRNLDANAASIVTYLDLTAAERPIQSLPLHYSYGLSILNSHLLAGACTLLTPHSFIRPEFWAAFDGFGCTSFAGIPYMYETLGRLRFVPATHPSLRTMTQAGGGLRPDLVRHFHTLCDEAGVRFFVMYGQTEATARIAYVPSEALADHVGCIGIAIPGGRLHLRPIEDDLAELVYEGPNVMLGYAEKPADLALGDQLGGVLYTGDLAVRDADGFFRLVGRLQRFAKLFGRRVSLEDLERELEGRFAVQAAATSRDDHVTVYVEGLESEEPEVLRAHLTQLLHVPPVAVTVVEVGRLPRTSAGKKDYKALEVA